LHPPGGGIAEQSPSPVRWFTGTRPPSGRTPPLDEPLEEPPDDPLEEPVDPLELPLDEPLLDPLDPLDEPLLEPPEEPLDEPLPEPPLEASELPPSAATVPLTAPPHPAERMETSDREQKSFPMTTSSRRRVQRMRQPRPRRLRRATLGETHAFCCVTLSHGRSVDLHRSAGGGRSLRAGSPACSRGR
jgi:hypothetical protein